MVKVRNLCHFRLDPVQPFTALVNCALAVAHCNILEPGGKQQLRNGDGCRSCTGSNNPHIFFLFADYLQGIGQTRQRNNSSAVLVIVENRDVTLFFQLALNFKATGCRNIFKVNTAKRARDIVDGFHKFIYVLCFNTDGKCVYIAKCLEQHTFTLHNRHTGFRANIT